LELILKIGLNIFVLTMMVGLPIIFYKFPPKKRNSVYGYRTKLAMESDENFFFATNFSTILMLKFSLISAGIHIVLGLLIGFELNILPSTIFWTLLLLYSVRLTEKELKIFVKSKETSI